MVNDVTTVRIPGLTVGGALQVSNTTVITAALAGVAISLVTMYCLGDMKNRKQWGKQRRRHSPRAIENKVYSDVISYATDINTVAHNLPAVRNVIHTLNPRIKATINAYDRGEMTAEQFDSTIRNLYPMVLNELGLPANSIPTNLNNNLNNKVDKIADRILEGRIPVHVKFRMYKNHPGLAKLHELGRDRALQMGQGHKYGLHKQLAMHTSAGIYLEPQSHFGSWEKQYS